MTAYNNFIDRSPGVRTSQTKPRLEVFVKNPLRNTTWVIHE
jgi:hypothetical protein